ncbi:hypothetical protein NKI39_09030 [Mesorhizobium sp. M0664]|uniref:hypothetical protein n=1 Tax=Mesorhizobium sp. M0664 TaxID=2956982 RepID=UPI003339A5BE
MAAAMKAARPKKEMPDTGRRAPENKSQLIKDKFAGAEKEVLAIIGVPIAFADEDRKSRTALKARWFSRTKRALVGRALKAACIIDDQFMVKTLSMHRTDEWLASHYGCSERTIQRCFADLRDAGFCTIDAVVVKFGPVFRVVGRRIALCLPPGLVEADAPTNAVHAATNAGHAPTKTVNAPTDVGAPNLGKETLERRPFERKQQGPMPALSENEILQIEDSPITEGAIDELMESGKTEKHAFNILRSGLAKELGIEKDSPKWEPLCKAVEIRRARASQEHADYRGRIEEERKTVPPGAAEIFAEIKADISTNPDFDQSRRSMAISVAGTLEELALSARMTIRRRFDAIIDRWGRDNPRARRPEPYRERYAEFIEPIVTVYLERNKHDLPRVAKWRDTHPNWQHMKPEDTMIPVDPPESLKDDGWGH